MTAVIIVILTIYHVLPPVQVNLTCIRTPQGQLQIPEPGP